MSTVIRPVISKRNKYYISKHRYYELKHFCLQYPEWKQEYLYLDSLSNPEKSPVGNLGKTFQDPTYDAASRRLYLRGLMDSIEDAAKASDPVIGIYIFKAVTEDLSFVQLKMKHEIPCERDMYYDRYRKFFYILSQSRINHPL